MPAKTLLATATVIAAVLAGCGGSTALSADEHLTVSEAKMRVAHLVLDGRDYGPTLDAVDDVIALYRAKPDAEYDGRTMGAVLDDLSADLAPYRPEMATQLATVTD